MAVSSLEIYAMSSRLIVGTIPSGSPSVSLPGRRIDPRCLGRRTSMPVFSRRENNCFYCLGTGNCESPFNRENNCFYCLGTANRELPFNRENNCFYCLGTVNRELHFNRENNRFYRLGTRNWLFLIVWDAEENFMDFPVGKIIVSIVLENK